MKRSSASSRRLKTRSSVSSRSSSRDLGVGRDVVGVDHRQVEPRLHAVVEEDRVEHRARAPARRRRTRSTRRARSSRPGSSALMRRMPSIVSTALGRHSSSPVVSVKVSASKISSSGSSPCSSQAMSRMRLAISTLRSAVLAMPTSSMVSAISAAPWALASGITLSALSRPASRLIELTIAAAGDLLERRLDHLGLGRVDLDRRRLGQRHALDHLPHLLVLVLALGERHAEVEHVRAAGHLVLGHLHEAVVVVGQQQLLGLARALRVHALAHERGRAAPARAAWRSSSTTRSGRPGLGARRRGSRPPTRSTIARMWSGVVPQQPPTIDHAVALHELLQRVGQRLGLLGEDRLALGALERQPGVGDAVHRQRARSRPRKRIASRMSSGPVEQLSPITSTSSAVSVVSTAWMSVPSSILPPFGSSETLSLDRQRLPGLLEGLARAEDRGLDLEDVLRRLDDDQVGAALDQAARPAR